LIGFAADESVNVFEATAAGRPLVEWAERAGLPGGDFVALAELSGRISVQFEDLGQRRLVVRAN
jgi:hypothetical protein